MVCSAMTAALACVTLVYELKDQLTLMCRTASKSATVVRRQNKMAHES